MGKVGRGKKFQKDESKDKSRAEGTAKGEENKSGIETAGGDTRGDSDAELFTDLKTAQSKGQPHPSAPIRRRPICTAADDEEEGVELFVDLKRQKKLKEK